MRKDITLVAETRETRGKNAARRLRVQHLSPAVLYGTGGDPVALAGDSTTVECVAEGGAVERERAGDEGGVGSRITLGGRHVNQPGCWRS